MRVVQIPLTYPLHYERLLCIHHVSSLEHASFNPVPATPHSTPQTPPRPVCRCLSFSSAVNYTLQTALQYAQTAQMKKRKISQWYPWMMNTGLLKKHLTELSASTKNYNTLSYMDSLDLSDISDYEDYMVTFSDEEILGMERVPY